MNNTATAVWCQPACTESRRCRPILRIYFALSVLEAKYFQYVLQASERVNIHYVYTGNKRVNYFTNYDKEKCFDR